MNLSELLDALEAAPDYDLVARTLTGKPVHEDRGELIRAFDIAFRLGSLTPAGAQSLLSALTGLEVSSAPPDSEELRTLTAEIARLERELEPPKPDDDESIIAVATERKLASERGRKLAELDSATARVSKLERSARSIKTLSKELA